MYLVQVVRVVYCPVLVVLKVQVARKDQVARKVLQAMQLVMYPDLVVRKARRDQLVLQAMLREIQVQVVLAVLRVIQAMLLVM
jgi:hypothetical protein